MTVGYDEFKLLSPRGYLFELGGKLKEMPESIQKRWVRKKAEEHFGHPVKNPTQKREWWHCYFSETVQKEPGVWFVYIKDPNKE